MKFKTLIIIFFAVTFHGHTMAIEQVCFAKIKQLFINHSYVENIESKTSLFSQWNFWAKKKSPYDNFTDSIYKATDRNIDYLFNPGLIFTLMPQLTGEIAAKNNEFLKLHSFNRKLRNVISKLMIEGKEDRIFALFKKFRELIQDDISLIKLKDQNFKKANLDNLSYSERLNHYNFVTEIVTLNKLLPVDLRIPIFRITKPRPPHNIGSIESAKNLLRKFENDFKNFSPSKHFKNYNQYVSFIDKMAKKSDLIKFWKNIFDHTDEMELFVYAPAHIGSSIKKYGMLNRHVTDTYTYGHPNIAYRTESEKFYAHLSDDEYSNLGPRTLPVYAIIRKKNDTFVQSSSASNYGDGGFVLDLEAVKDRLSILPGDTLVSYQRSERKKSIADYKNTWGRRFIPWKYRYFIFPEILGDELDRLDLQHDITRPISDLLAKLLKSIGKSNIAKILLEKSTPNGNAYIEAQIWGKIPFDPKYFVAYEYPKLRPPSQLYLRELLEMGIEVREVSFWKVKNVTLEDLK